LAGHGGSRPGYGDAVGRGGEPEAAKNRAASGVINDYITWLVTGVAAIGAALALIVR
jgi:hypothetical protein